jgi:hypothetical protein
MSLSFSGLDGPARRAALRALWSAGAVGLALAGCGEEAPLRTPPEQFTVLEGMPKDAGSKPAVDRHSEPHDFRPSRPHRCDTFTQPPNRKLDVLWVVDSSRSMGDIQARLSTYFTETIRTLTRPDRAVDFQLGVVTTDIDRSSPAEGIGPGWLRRPDGAVGDSANFIACQPEDDGVRCNVGDGSPAAAEQAFDKLVRVGTEGSPEEKGLHAAMLALSEPLVSGWNAGFLRPDADLSIVFVSDEEDSSCFPYVVEEPCLAGPSCKCDTSPTWGSVAYFDRFFRGLKGLGREASVRVGAIVATEEDTLDFPDDTGRAYVGCTSDASRACAVGGGEGAACALHAPRYAAVAQASGGTAVDICADEYASGLEELGLGASGLRSEFALARTPHDETIDVVVVPNVPIVCNDAAPCSSEFPDCVRGICSRHVERGLHEGWEYVICSGGSQCDVVRFSGRSIPKPNQTITVCYDVDVGA